MQNLYRLLFAGITIIIINISSSCATEVFGLGEDSIYKRPRSQFDLRLAEESIQEEKKEAHQQGYEEGIEKGRMEHLRQVVSKMMRMNQPDSIIAEVNELTIDQLKKIKASLDQ